MRWALACVVAFGGVASARVIRIPPVASACSEERTWDDVTACAGGFGTVKIERTLPHARLVRITNPTAGDRSRAGDECEQGEVVPLLLQDDPD